MIKINNFKTADGKKKQHFLSGVIMCLIVVAIIPVAIFEFTKSSIQEYFNSFKKSSSQSFSGMF